MFLLTPGKRKQPICRACKRLHAAKDCPKAICIPVLTVREMKLRARLQEQYGRSLSWEEVLQIDGKYPKFVRVG
jgi:hypothetical protein